jgi:hypothetical protein
VLYGKILDDASVAQWIERRPPEPKARVRASPEALHCTSNGKFQAADKIVKIASGTTRGDFHIQERSSRVPRVESAGGPSDWRGASNDRLSQDDCLDCITIIVCTS